MSKPIEIAAALDVLAIFGFMLFLLINITNDNTLAISARMSTSCEQKKPDCQQLIQRIEGGGNYEVLSDSLGHYWIEAK